MELVKTRYPQGAEKQLVEALLGRKVAPGKLPMTAGVVVQNVGTCFAVFEAIARKKPLIERVVTVSGKGALEPGNFLAKIGTPVSVLMEAAKMNEDLVRAMISGGPMMGQAFGNNSVPVVKAMSGILLMDESEFTARQEQDCIRCGKCVDACPMSLIPCDLVSAAEFGEYDEAPTAEQCVECGCCQYVCPSRRFLVQWVRLVKLMRRRNNNG